MKDPPFLILCFQGSGGVYLSDQRKPISIDFTPIVPVEVLRKFHNFNGLSDFPFMIVVLSCNYLGVFQTHMMFGLGRVLCKH